MQTVHRISYSNRWITTIQNTNKRGILLGAGE